MVSSSYENRLPFSLSNPFNGGNLILLDGFFLLLLPLSHRLQVFLMFLSRLSKVLIVAKRLECYRIKLHFLCGNGCKLFMANR